VNRALKAGTVALGVVGLLVLVALASRGGHPGTGSVTPRPVPARLQDDFVTLLAVAYVFTIIVVIVLMFGRRPWHAPEEQWRWLRNLVSAGLVLLILTGAGYWALHHRPTAGTNARQNGPGQGVIGPRAVPGPSSPDEVRRAHFQWPLALGLGGLVVLGGAALLLQDRLAERGRMEETSVADELAQVVETTVEDLRAEKDPRRAVIAAYAKMERVLSSHGLARKRAETQLEYLGRILTELEVGEAAVQRLTELFAYAKFSPHTIDETMRGEAIEALTAVQRDLRLGERVAA
jgi:Domain of unknown function (DUF4129)